MLKIGLNPYGLTFTVGLQGRGTARVNPRPIGPGGFIALAHDIGAECIELDSSWLLSRPEAWLQDLRRQIESRAVDVILSHGLTHQPGETLTEPLHVAVSLGARLIRMHATPVLEGARAQYGVRWDAMLDHVEQLLRVEAPYAADLGIGLAIEDHQDLGSDELIGLAHEAGDNVGIVLDTGNPLAVGEDPVDFTRRVAPLVRHVHLKDYRAQLTTDGFRLVRCAIGDGCVPFQEIAAILAASHQTLTASIEPAALEARHIRLFRPEWWQGYPPRRAGELDHALQRLKTAPIGPDGDYRTPWEREAPPAELVAYERMQLQRSLDNLHALGLR